MLNVRIANNNTTILRALWKINLKCQISSLVIYRQNKQTQSLAHNSFLSRYSRTYFYQSSWIQIIKLQQQNNEYRYI